MAKHCITAMGTILALAFFTTGVQAQVPVKRWGTLRLCHGTGTYVLRQAGGRVFRDQKVEATIRLQLRAEEAVSIWIEDPNPLLFTYRSGGVESTPTADSQVLASLVAALGPLVATEPAEAAEDFSDTATPDPVSDLLREIRANVGKLHEKTDQIAALTAQTATPRGNCFTEGRVTARQSVKDTVAGWDVDGLTNRIDTGYSMLRRLAAEAFDGSAVVVSGEELSEGGETVPPDDTAGASEIPSDITGPATFSEDVESGDEASRSASQNGSPESTASEVALRNEMESLRGRNDDNRRLVLLLLALQSEPAIGEALESLQQFAKKVGQIDEPLQVVEEIAFDSTNERSVELEIAVVAENAEAAARTGRRTNSITFVTEPYSFFAVRAGGGLVWADLDRPTFFARSQGDELVVGQALNDTPSTTVSAMVNLIPRPLAREVVAPFFQLGVRDDRRRVAVFFGLGTTILNEHCRYRSVWRSPRSMNLSDNKLGRQ